MKSLLKWAVVIAVLTRVTSLQALDTDFPDDAAWATNDLGIDLLHQFAKNDENLCLSPFNSKRTGDDICRGRRKHAHGDGARFAFSKQWRCRPRVVRRVAVVAGRDG